MIKVVKAFCVEKYEYPGSGSMPHTNVALAQAEQACRGRGRRLCTAREWRGACGGKYPYRGPYDSSRCNTVGEDGMGRPVTPTGSYTRCRSGWGTYDMVGNVAEWTRGGFVHGGSAQRDGRSATCNRKARRIGASPKVGFRCCADAKRRDIQ
jgi:formylglycine-generating enzyme required for sulfatase activity